MKTEYGQDPRMSTDCLSDEGWTLRCIERLVALDPELKPALAQPIAADLCSRPRWRAMLPEHAAQTLFDYGAKG